MRTGVLQQADFQFRKREVYVWAKGDKDQREKRVIDHGPSLRNLYLFRDLNCLLLLDSYPGHLYWNLRNLYHPNLLYRLDRWFDYLLLLTSDSAVCMNLLVVLPGR